MTENMATGLVTIILGILGVAALAVWLSPKAQTANVIKAGGSALAQDIGAAVSPITGASMNMPAIGSSAFGMI